MAAAPARAESSATSTRFGAEDERAHQGGHGVRSGEGAVQLLGEHVDHRQHRRDHGVDFAPTQIATNLAPKFAT